MPELLTLQDLANGHLDVKALGEAANGDENTIVTTRTGNTYPSAERAINIMFQNGGLPAVPFPTLAKMQTDGASLADGQLAQVYNETANNGLYVKTEGAWGKATYDPLAQAKAYSDLTVEGLDISEKVINSLFSVADEAGNKAIDIKVPTVVDASGISTSIADIKKSKSLSYIHTVADAQGNILYGVNNQGQFVANFSLVPQVAPTEKERPKGYDAEINHVFAYGQSLSVGQALPVISTTQNYDNLMFTRGMRPQYDYPSETPAEWYASLVPAVEVRSTANTALGETPSMGTGDAIKQFIFDEDGLSYTDMSYQIMLSASGWGATTIAQLSKGTTHYARTVEQAAAAKSLAAAQNKSYTVQAITWTQGESDELSSTSRATYLSLLDKLIDDLNVDIKAAIAQEKEIPFISYQTASHKVANKTDPTIALAQLELSELNNNFFIATPMYHMTYLGAKDFHLTGESSRWLGAYYGLAYKRIVINGEDWQPLKPLSSKKEGKYVDIKFHVPSGRLVLDTTLVTENANYGFELVTSAGVSIPITQVKIVNIDTVKILTTTTIPVGAKVRYAWSGSGNVGRIDGPRGNLRDTQGDTVVFDPTGINKAMHNWCLIFEMEI